MKKKLGLAAALAGSLTLACSVPVVAGNHNNCQTAIPKLTVKEYHIEFDMKVSKCASVGIPFLIDVHAPPGGGIDIETLKVSVAKKTDSPGPDATVTGDNSADPEELWVTVGGTVPLGTEVTYLIKIDEVGELDPKIKIIDNNMLLDVQTHAAEQAVRALGGQISELTLVHPNDYRKSD